MPVLTEKQIWRKPRSPSNRPYRLTDDQAALMKVALRVVHLRLENWSRVAEALGYTLKYLRKVNGRQGRVAGAMPVRLAQSLGVPVEDLLAGACPMCGSRCQPRTM